MYIEHVCDRPVYGGLLLVESLYPKCRGKTYGRLPLGKRRMEAPKIERQHHEII